MNPNLKVFRVHRALTWIYGVVGILLVAVLAAAPGESSFITSLVLICAFGPVCLMHFLTARACKQGKAGGRYASIVIACLMLVGFPIGTAIGAYLLANTWRSWPASLE